MNSTGKNSMYYIHTDYLGSYQTITNEQGNVVEELSFGSCLPVRNEMKAGGRRRNPTDWTYNNVPTSHLFDRGYTGHEHLDNFDLINMNGRVYDPWLGRFLSPDPFVQAPTYSQNFNRYSYAFNNPLKFTDPSGYYTRNIATGFNWNWSRLLGPGNDMNSFYARWRSKNNYYTYDYNSGQYYLVNGMGERTQVGFNEVNNNYVLPNATVNYEVHAWHDYVGTTKNPKMYDNGVSYTLVKYTSKPIPMLGYTATVYELTVGNEADRGEGEAGGGNPVQTVNDVSNYTGIVLSAAQQTIQNTKVGSNVAYRLSGNTKVLNGVNNTFKYTPYVGLGITVLTGTYLSRNINPATGQPYQSWAETGTDIGMNIATIYIGAQYGGWYGAGAAVFYLGVKTNVQYQIKNDINPGMNFILFKE